MLERIQQLDHALRGLASRGWQSTRLADGWRLTRKVNEGQPSGVPSVLYAGANEHWLYLSLPLDTDAAQGTGMTAYRCLRLSADRFGCKYSLDDAGTLLLQAELPAADVERGELYTALEAMLRAAEAPTEQTAESGEERAAPREDIEYFPRLTLDVYFKSLKHSGWMLRRNLGANHWHLVYKAAERPFDVYLSFNPLWAYFQIPMLAASHAVGPEQEALCRYLLRLNEQIYWARFGMDDGGQIVLTLDVPLSALTTDRFRLAAQSLATYASDYAYEIQILAGLNHDPALARLLPV